MNPTYRNTPLAAPRQASWHIRTVPDSVLWRPVVVFALVLTCMAAAAGVIDLITVHFFMGTDAEVPTVLFCLQCLLGGFFFSLLAAVAGLLPIAMVSLYYARRKQSLARSAWLPGLTVAGLYLVVMLVCYATHESAHPDKHIGLIIRNIVVQLAYPATLLAGVWSLHRAFIRRQEPPKEARLYRRCHPRLAVNSYVHFAVGQTILLLLACAPPLLGGHVRTQVVPLAMLAYSLLYSSVLYMPFAWYILHRAQRTPSVARAVWPPTLGAFLLYTLVIIDDCIHLHLFPEAAAAFNDVQPWHVAYYGADLTIIAPALALIPAAILLHRHIARHSEPVA